MDTLQHTLDMEEQMDTYDFGLKDGEKSYKLELQTFKILAAERLRLIKMGTRLIADYFQNAVNILKW